MYRLLSSVLLSCLVLFLVGCSPFKPVSGPIKQRYALTAFSQEVRYRHPGNKTLLVTMPKAGPTVETASMVYLQHPYHIQRFSENSWVAPPANMLLPLIAQSVRSSGYFEAVVTAPHSAVADLRLDSQLLTFQHEFIEKPSRVRMRIQVTLSDDKTNEVIASQRFSEVVRVNTDKLYAGVVAANYLTEKMTKKITDFVLAYVRK